MTNEKNLLDQFAIAALAGGLEQGIEDDLHIDWFHRPAKIAERAYDIAEAMLRESRKREQKAAIKLSGAASAVQASINRSGRDLMTIPEFCQANGGISRGMFFKMVSEGKGPRITKVGRRTFVTPEDGAAWREKLQGPQ